MSWLGDTIAGRTILVLVLGIGSILAFAQYLYQSGIEREVSVRNTETIVERLLVVADTITSVEAARRDDAAHRLSGGLLELHWGREPLATAGGNLDPVTQALRDRLLDRAPNLRENGLIIGTSRSTELVDGAITSRDETHTTLVSLLLSDASWLNVTLARVQVTRAASPSVILSAALGALGIVMVSILMSRWLTQPLERLAAGARRLFVTSDNAPLPETGTREVRTLASAINDLQRRIGRLVDDRTQMLAAVSHDLRTPLTRLRLRTAGLENDQLRRSIEDDIGEMEQMIDATLAFLRHDLSAEKMASVDLAAIIATIASDSADAGHHVVVTSPRHLVVDGRHLALKRALSNLLQNAIKYAGNATLAATTKDGVVTISVCDDGPGIPLDKLETVFEPFTRLEPSRARSFGGHGLGLTVARSIARAHGGDVVLRNRSPTGLEALLTLPVRDAENGSGA